LIEITLQQAEFAVLAKRSPGSGLLAGRCAGIPDIRRRTMGRGGSDAKREKEPEKRYDSLHLEALPRRKNKRWQYNQYSPQAAGALQLNFCTRLHENRRWNRPDFLYQAATYYRRATQSMHLSYPAIVNAL
jgi:hypothetical protein